MVAALGNAIECVYYEDCARFDENAFCSDNSCVCANGTHRDIDSGVVKCNSGRALNDTCESSDECSEVDHLSRCLGGFCRCKPGTHESPTAIGLRCFPGRIARPLCDAERPCGSHSFVCTPWGTCECRLPGYKAELLFSRWRCIQDPFFFEGRTTVTFLKVSPVPLLVICIMLAYFGYQRKAKSPPAHRSMREASRLHNRRIVPLWRGVTFRSAPTRSSATTAHSQSQGPVSPPAARPTTMTAVAPPHSVEVVLPQGDVSPPPPYQAEPDDAPPSYDEVVRSLPALPPASHVISVPDDKSCNSDAKQFKG
ncbi:uncharacterized protein LOC135396917 isoform X2 [Ornithodoros turicata]|uniref:uncharacterized protein LOC135375220 isoform X2 n=1 Tax=Ornithodoros turicata TaxID=34597 RepID=UPI0031396EE7